MKSHWARKGREKRRARGIWKSEPDRTMKVILTWIFDHVSSQNKEQGDLEG